MQINKIKIQFENFTNMYNLKKNTALLVEEKTILRCKVSQSYLTPFFLILLVLVLLNNWLHLG